MLEIRKIEDKVWRHVDTIDGYFFLTKFYVKVEFTKFKIVEAYGAKRRDYTINEIQVYDAGGSAETFTNFDDLMNRLAVLKYPAYYTDGEFTFDPNNYDLSEFQNSEVDRFAKLSDITSGIEEAPTDGNLYGRKNAGWEVVPVGGSDDTFVLSFPRLAISGNATNVFFASFINTSSVIFNSSTAISDHTLLSSINFANTRLFIIPQDCIIDKITCNSNVNFELSIWKADSLSSPTTGKVEVFYEPSASLIIANYNVASPTLSQGNILVPMIKALGGTSTYYGDLFITFKTI